MSEKDLGSLSQWQLTKIRFMRHKIAVASLLFLVAMYSIALFAPFVAPNSQTWRDVEYSNCPPMLPRFNFKDGLHVKAMVQKTHPITLKRYYETKTDTAVPLGFFVKGEPYKLLGFIPLERRLIAADTEEAKERGVPLSYARFYLLGADRFGHDVFSRILLGSQISLSIGLIAIAFNFAFGISIGGASGYFGGKTDVVVQRLIEILNSFPHIPLWLAMAAVIPISWGPLQTYFGITIMLSLLTWTNLARVVRGKILSLREEDYAVAARLLGASHERVLFRHLIPGFTSHIIVALTLSVPYMIIGETALSFLGLGLRPPVVSWGVMLQDCINMQIVANYPWLLMPVIMITTTVLAFNFLGDGLRDAADPHAS